MFICGIASTGNLPVAFGRFIVYVLTTLFVFIEFDMSSVSKQVKNIIVLGAGLTGAAVALNVRCNAEIWEKSRGIGNLLIM